MPVPAARLAASVVVVGVALALGPWSGGTPAAQAPARVDFAGDVQPLLRQRCVGCHGRGSAS